MSFSTSLLKSPHLKYLGAGLLLALIVSIFVVSVTVLTGFTLLVVVGYAFRFATRQMILLKTFTVDFINRLFDRFIKLYKEKIASNGLSK
jgi:hypothetical protein